MAIEKSELEKAVRQVVRESARPTMLVSARVRALAETILGKRIGPEYSTDVREIMRSEVAALDFSPAPSPKKQSKPQTSTKPKEPSPKPSKSTQKKRPRPELEPSPKPSPPTEQTPARTPIVDADTSPKPAKKPKKLNSTDPMARVVSSKAAEAAAAPETPDQSIPQAAAHAAAGVGTKAKHVHASSLPLEIPAAVARQAARLGSSRRTSMLVQLDDEAMDLEGDSGAIGRLTVSSEGVIFDLKGHRYAGTIVPCCTHAVVAVGPTKAKVEMLTDDFVFVDHLANVVDDMGGVLVRGSRDASDLLRFEDLDARVDDDDEEEEDGKNQSKRKKKQQMLEEEEEEEGGDMDDFEYEDGNTPKQKKKPARGAAAKVTKQSSSSTKKKPKKMIGRTARVKKGSRKK